MNVRNPRAGLLSLVLVGCLTLLGSSARAVDYYVNDTNTVNDMYTTAAGGPFIGGLIEGLTPATPLLTLNEVLSRHNIEPGDRIFIDTGLYKNGGIAWPNQDVGSAGMPVEIIGSTMTCTGGVECMTIIEANNPGVTQDCFLFQGNDDWITFRNLMIRGYGRNAFWINGGDNLVCEDVIFYDNTKGVFHINGDNPVFRRCMAINCEIGHEATRLGGIWENGVSVSNDIAFLFDAVTFVNNSIVVGGIAFDGDVTPRGDYNMFWNVNVLKSDINGGDPFVNLKEMADAEPGSWVNSTFANPWLKDPANFDARVQSPAGSYDVATSNFLNDTERSAAIDYGPTNAPVGGETAPNGGRLNIGAFGGTAQASRTPPGLWLQTISYNDGGILSVPTDAVRWTGNHGPADLVRIEYSEDSGQNWVVVETGIPGDAGMYVWANTNFMSNREARWRVVNQATPSIMSSNLVDFTFRNGPFLYYLDDPDPSNSGDIYTPFAHGDDMNTGTSPTNPMATLSALLLQNQLSDGDIVFIDTGTYNFDSIETITSADSGSPGKLVHLLGSTNGVLFTPTPPLN
ncbi:MAG: hypothetical protein AAF492_09565 [Verrucomicrobiota bacterium]